MTRSRHALTLHEAAQGAPSLARLLELALESRDRLQAVEHLIPAALRSAILAGPIDGASWCLLVSSNAAAAKLRQLVPALQAHLRSRGCEINSIRLKVQIV
jgi:hypothetical protein